MMFVQTLLSVLRTNHNRLNTEWGTRWVSIDLFVRICLRLSAPWTVEKFGERSGVAGRMAELVCDADTACAVSVDLRSTDNVVISYLLWDYDGI